MRIQTVHVGGMAESLGLKPGDEILSIGGEPIRDPIDFRFHFSEDEVALYGATPEPGEHDPQGHLGPRRRHRGGGGGGGRPT